MNDDPSRLTLSDGPSSEPRLAKQDEIDRLRTAVSSALLLLVHGYNNPVPDARKAFDAFETIQRDLAQAQDFAPGLNVAHVYWPGGQHFWQFMEVIRSTPVSAQALADSLEAIASAQQRPLFVSVVAHSLGCRLVLEAVRILAARPASRVVFDRLMFFAPAVATQLLEDPPDTRLLRESYALKVHGGARSLFSPADAVLSAAFPLGSTLAGKGEPSWATALGHGYWASPTRPANLGQTENQGAGHSDYWGCETETAGTNGRFAGQEARAFLQWANGPRPTPVRYQRDRAAEARELDRRELERRQVADPATQGP